MPGMLDFQPACLNERLILRLKTHLRSEYPDISRIRAQIAGSDVTLFPRGAGYDENSTSIPALFAASLPEIRFGVSEG